MMLTLNLVRILIRRRPTRRMHRTLNAPTLEEPKSKVRRARFALATLELAFRIRIIAPWIKDAAAVYLVEKLTAILARPVVDAVDFKGRVAEAVIGCDVAGRAGDGSSR